MKYKLLALSVMVATLGLSSLSGSAVVAQANEDKVTICHRTNSVQNPYNRQSVASSSADGNTANDRGQGDHSEHTGQVPTNEDAAQSLKDNKQDWGDIIPPHNNYGGLNWSAQGQAVYNNNCNYAEPGRGGEDPTPDNGGQVRGTSTTSGAQTVAPSGGVAAGFGGSSALNPVALAGLGGSLASLVTGIIWSAKRRF